MKYYTNGIDTFKKVDRAILFKKEKYEKMKTAYNNYTFLKLSKIIESKKVKLNNHLNLFILILLISLLIIGNRIIEGFFKQFKIKFYKETL